MLNGPSDALRGLKASTFLFAMLTAIVHAQDLLPVKPDPTAGKDADPFETIDGDGAALGDNLNGSGDDVFGSPGENPFGGGPQGSLFARNADMSASPNTVQTNEIIVVWSPEKSELRGFSVESGQWSVRKVLGPAKSPPVASGFVAVIRLTDAMAAYSGKTGTWDLLKLSPKSKALPVLQSNQLAQIREGGHLYTFAAALGKWTSPTDASPVTPEETYELSYVFKPGTLTAKLPVIKKRMSELPDGALEQMTATGDVLKFSCREANVSQVLSMIRDMGDDSAAQLSIGRGLPAGGLRPGASAPVTTIGPPPASRDGRPNRGISAIDQQAIELATRLRDSRCLDCHKDLQSIGADYGETPATCPFQLQNLRSMVTKALDEQLQSQTRQVDDIRAKLVRVEEALRVRTANRDKIIERRVDELLQPDVTWPGGRPAHGVSGQVSAAGLPSPVLLPGPAHLPEGKPLAARPPYLKRSEAATPYGIGGRRPNSGNTTTASPLSAAGTVSNATVQLGQIVEELKTNHIAVLRQEALARAGNGDQHQTAAALAEWNFAWQQYESLIRKCETDLKIAEVRILQAVREDEILRAELKNGTLQFGKIQIQQAAARIELAELELRQAKHVLDQTVMLKTRLPHLNPNNPRPVQQVVEPVDKPAADGKPPVADSGTSRKPADDTTIEASTAGDSDM